MNQCRFHDGDTVVGCSGCNPKESSGRWDAEGSFNESCFERREVAFKWASGLDIHKLHWMIMIMASDSNAFTLYERKALLEVVAIKLGKEIDGTLPSR